MLKVEYSNVQEIKTLKIKFRYSIYYEDSPSKLKTRPTK